MRHIPLPLPCSSPTHPPLDLNQCYTRFDYIDHMVMITVAPPVILALIGLVYAIHRAYLCYQVRPLFRPLSRPLPI